MSARYTGGLVYNAPGGWSGLFNGTTSNLSLPYSANYVPGTGDFTVECWVLFNDISTNTRGLFSLGYGANGSGPVTCTWQLRYLGSEGSNQMQWERYDGSTETQLTTSGFSPANNVWYHIAVSRTGGYLRIFINGTAFYSAANTFNYSAINTSDPFLVGLSYNGPQSGMNGPRYFPGYISNIRFIKGTGIYSANFTPPTGRLAAITNTQLLLCQSPTFVDNSSNAATVTNNSATVNTLNPFPTSQLPNPALGGAGNGVYTMSQYAALKAANLWPAYDPYYKNVTLNLHGNAGAVLPFNTDASTNNFQVTQVGDTRPSNYTPFIENGYWSNYFGGSGNSLNYPSASQYAIGTGNFTVEFFVNFASLNAGHNRMFCIGASGTDGLELDLNGTNFEVGIQNGYPIGYTWTPTAGTWYYIAVTRSGSTVTLYINGTSVATGTSSNNISQNSLSIGGISWVGSWSINGYLSNVRLSNTVRTIAVPTAPYTSDANTLFLGAQSNRFLDNSSYAATATPTGSPSVNPFQPFTAPTGTSAYGSGYFDGSGDWLSLTSSSTALPTGTQDFSVEMWLYWQTQGGSYPQIISNPTTNGFQIYYDVGSSLLAVGIFNVSNVITYSIAQSALSGAWNHIAVTRSGNTFRLFVNGVLQSNGTNTISFASLTTQYIGSDGSRPYTGYISNVRTCLGSIPTSYQTSSTTNGTSVFSVPTAPITTSSQGASNTALLTVQTNAPSQNNTFLDSSTNNFVITRNGNTTQGTFTPYGPNGYWSVGFTGAQTSPSLTYPSISAYDLGSTSQWTYECWVYFASVSGEQSIFERWSGTGGPGWLLTKLSTNAYRAHFGSSVYIDTGAIAVAGQWIHLAVSRDGSTGSLFVDGVRQATTSSVANFSDGTDPLVFGERNSGSQTFPFNGYISNARIVKGTYVYNPSSTSITVPTAPLTAVTNTVFLGLQSNRYLDNSSNNATATASSASSTQRFSPFAPPAYYQPSVIGGSGYFDGSGDWLTAPSNAGFGFGTGDFTIEGWVYWTGGSNENTFFCVDVTSGANIFLSIGGNWGIGTRGIAINNNFGTPPTKNVWNHLAVSRSGSTIRAFINGAQVFSGSNSTNYATGSPGIAAIPTVSSNIMSGYITDFRVVKGTAVYTSAFTPPTAPLTAITNTSLLLSYTNAGILDNAMMNDLETVGNAQISTSVKKYGTGSMYFDGNGDYLLAPDSPNTELGSGDFTVECWAYYSSTSGTPVLIDKRSSTAGYSPFIFYTTGGTLVFYSSSNGSSYDIANGVTIGSVTTGTWYHVAASRSGTSIRLFLNGVLGNTVTTSASLVNNSDAWSIGGTPGGNYLNGYIDDLRITKGVARYTANFTPPTSQVQDQ